MSTIMLAVGSFGTHPADDVEVKTTNIATSIGVIGLLGDVVLCTSSKWSGHAQAEPHLIVIQCLKCLAWHSVIVRLHFEANFIAAQLGEAP